MAVLDDDLSDRVGISARCSSCWGRCSSGGIVGSLLRLESQVRGVRWLAAEPARRGHRLGGAAPVHRGASWSPRWSSARTADDPGLLNDGLRNGAEQLVHSRPPSTGSRRSRSRRRSAGASQPALDHRPGRPGLLDPASGLALGDVLPDRPAGRRHRHRRPPARRRGPAAAAGAGNPGRRSPSPPCWSRPLLGGARGRDPLT